MGRRIRTTVPQVTKCLTPDWPYLPEFRDKNKNFKMQQKADYDRRHQARDAPEIPNDADVWVTTLR